MTKECYERMTGMFRDDPKRTCLLHRLNQICTWTVMAAYGILLFTGVIQRSQNLYRNILVPFDSFIVVTVLRILVNRKRPYEEFGIAPVIPKETRGKSFPSRHVFSAFVIAMTYLCNTTWWGIGVLLVVLSVLIAAIRVVSGVHYISDVVIGAICGISAGVAGYLVW